MADTVEIPRLDDPDKTPGAPGWISVTTASGRPLKPLVRCMCGEIFGIGNHHVHADGRVTASFYCRDGSGWHVFLKLKDYDQGDMPPRGREGE